MGMEVRGILYGKYDIQQSLSGPLRYLLSISPGPKIDIVWSGKQYFKVSRVPPETSDPYLRLGCGNMPCSQVS